jgi:hypothetical protein
MGLARELGMTLKQLFANADSRELGLWMGFYRWEHDEQYKRDLAQRAESIRRK